jgi:transposase
MFVGIDVSQTWLDVCVRSSGQAWRVRNQAAPIAELVAALRELAPTLVVLEATGGYERAVVQALAAAAVPVAVLNPRQVRRFAQATGQWAKTDQLDAALLALYAEKLQPAPRPLLDAAQQAVRELVRRRQQVVELLGMEQQRQRQAVTPAMAERIGKHVQWLEEERAALEEAIAAAQQAQPGGEQRAALLRSVPGIGPLLSRTLPVLLPELGTLSGKQLAALAGVAPLARDSGRKQGKRVLFGGRAEVRRALYLAALSASRWNPPIRAFYQRLRAAGKAKKLALTACMHKLLLHLNAMLRKGEAWQPPASAAA